MLELDGAHGSFVQEEVLVSGRREQDTFGVQAAALKKGVWTSRGRVRKVQGGHTGNPTLLSWLSLVVVDWRKGLPGRRPAERCQGGGGGRSLAQGANDQGQMGGMKMRSFAASTLSRLQPRMDARERERESFW